MTLASLFEGVHLELEDLYLLEAFQIGYFPGWMPEPELAAVLWSAPSIERFLVKKCPSIAGFVESILAQHKPASNPQELERCTQAVLWTIPDLLVYNKCPEFYDSLEFHNWDFREVTMLTTLHQEEVVDAGAGTGRVALEAAQSARHVFAIEPVARLRDFIRQRASQAGLTNVFVLDGFNHAIPLPDGFADVLITSHALGWRLEKELREFERVVKHDGFIIHCPGTADRPNEEIVHSRLISPDWGYEFSRYRAPDGSKRKYWKRL